MTDSDDRRLGSPQFLGTVTNFEEFKKEKARKKAHEDSRDTRPDAEILAFPANEGWEHMPDATAITGDVDQAIKRADGTLPEDIAEVEVVDTDDPAARKAAIEKHGGRHLKSEADEEPHEHDCD